MCGKEDTIGKFRYILEGKFNAKVPLLEASTTIPQHMLAFNEAVSSQVSSRVKSQYCKNHHCKIVKESIFLELEMHCWDV